MAAKPRKSEGRRFDRILLQIQRLTNDDSGAVTSVISPHMPYASHREIIDDGIYQPQPGFIHMNNKRMTLQAWSPEMRSVLRIVAGLLFVQHGSAKLLHIPAQEMFAHLQLMSLLGAQGVIELVGGGLLTIGLFSRTVAFILSGDMAVAFFIAHFPRGWLPILNGGDLAVLFCFSFLYLWVAGPGPWSLDALLHLRKAQEDSHP